MKKSIVFSATLLTVAAAAVAFATSQIGLARIVKSVDNITWNHYSAVAATLDSRGSKE